jgi:hypothetical protein
LSSARFRPVALQSPEIMASCWTCRLTGLSPLRLLPCLDSIRVRKLQQCCLLTDVQSKPVFYAGLNTSMASEATSRTGFSDFPAKCLTSEIVGPSAFRHTNFGSGQLTRRRRSSGLGSLTDRSNAGLIRQKVHATERIAQGNAPNIGGSHEKRNVDQRSPAGREPDWRY